ncbi:hypothetical protein DICSQDRAFT_183596 [Dichomitus squalens LYAD-421 SS1]|uniref:Uncharacterized protein n=1 Tax=Dichomitus squalens (strain LYAD-421) TaxID=732165 RepID=R7SP90_DICSQ|nr:uncharacterized protein DICSQDRAFT_183596 [Dichomitus squalens LYAD-421 SS1]EJF56792.1 hypothetical protein DICSQDRAFT_183596 [Dichomitus squalens LYAD-421 SS1]
MACTLSAASRHPFPPTAPGRTLRRRGLSATTTHLPWPYRTQAESTAFPIHPALLKADDLTSTLDAPVNPPPPHKQQPPPHPHPTMAPPPRAPRRKACEALLPDGTTPCSATFRGWGRYCAAHLEEHARLAGRYKDAAARAERLRAKGALGEKQVRAMVLESVVGRALQRVRAYRDALGEERAAREAYLRRFPVRAQGAGAGDEGVGSRAGSPGSVQSDSGGERRESSRGSRFAGDERHEQRLAALTELQAGCDVLIEQLERRREEIVAAVQQRRAGREAVQGDSERQPLLAGGTPRPRTGRAWHIALFVVLLVIVLTLFMLYALGHIGTLNHAHS